MRALRLFTGMVAGTAVGLLICVLVKWLYPGDSVVAVLPSMAFVPVCVGFVAAWVWKPLDLRIGGMLLHSLSCTLISLTAAALAFQEGLICLIIMSPIVYFSVVAGALAGRLWFRLREDRLKVVLVPVVVLAVVAEPSFRGEHRSVVVDEIRIAAPPAEVWPHVLAFGPIPEAANYWLFRIGLPYPTETSNGGNFVGADRACHFSGGAVFKEKIAEIEPERLLTFDIVESPPHPELLGHLDATRGQFELRDNGDGTTTLIGRTWYSLHVRPARYFDWWTHEVFRAVHLRVMRNVKKLAEK